LWIPNFFIGVIFVGAHSSLEGGVANFLFSFYLLCIFHYQVPTRPARQIGALHDLFYVGWGRALCKEAATAVNTVLGCAECEKGCRGRCLCHPTMRKPLSPLRRRHVMYYETSSLFQSNPLSCVKMEETVSLRA